MSAPLFPKAVVCDVECYANYFYVGIKHIETGRLLSFERSSRSVLNVEKLRKVMANYTVVTFNGNGYDLPVIFAALAGATNERLKEITNTIIEQDIRPWDVARMFQIEIPRGIDHIDLMEPNPSVKDSLKTLNGRLHGKRMQDLPYHPQTVLTEDEMEIVSRYCDNDLDATELLFRYMQEPLQLRVALGERYGMDMRSKSDAQIGEAIVKTEIERMTGQRPVREPFKGNLSFMYDVPDFIRFQTPELQSVLEVIRTTEIRTDEEGKLEFPKAFEAFDIRIGQMHYKLGLGGLHSTEKSRCLKSDNQFALVDADVASQYPSIIMKLNLYPKALGSDFLKVYGNQIQIRLAAKKSGDKVADKGGKIALNGVYGKLGSIWSVLYAPHLLVAVTLTGQLSLLMLIEAAYLAGIEVVSGNTDGVVFRCPREAFDGLNKDRLHPSKLSEITDWWESVTSFKLEFAEYAAIYNRDVNTYIAIKPDGKAKRKGTVANHWCPNSPDYDPVRSQMMKSPQFTICGDAVLAFLQHGTPIAETIRSYDDIRGFVRIINAKGGATWRGEYLGKVCRYYWAKGGEPIYRANADPRTGNFAKVSETDGSRPLMTLPDELPDDIDYDAYIYKSFEILYALGWSSESGSTAWEDMCMDLLTTKKVRKRRKKAT